LSQTHYYKLSAYCFNDRIEMSCFNDPTGIAKGILTLTTDYGYDSQCHGSRADVYNQYAETFDDWNTDCEQIEDYDSSVRYRCINLPSDQLPFSVEAPNTYAEVGYVNDECSMDVDNVLTAQFWHINKCESSSNSDDFSENSRKISDCGFRYEFFDDYNCQDRSNFYSDVSSYDFECDDRRRLDTFDNTDYYRYSDSEMYFCADGNYGEYGNSNAAKKKADGDASLSRGKITLAEEVRLAFKQKFEERATIKAALAASSDASAAASEGTVSQQVITPMNYAYLGSVAFIGIVIGAVFTAKFFKSRNQFEGVEMQSTHSNI